MSDQVFIWIGRIVVVYFMTKILLNLYHVINTFVFPTYLDFSKYGKWTVVTGCTGGIGKDTAYEFASRGQNIILISRNKEKLEKVSKDIELKHGVETRILQIDFDNDESIYDVIEEFVKDYDIGVLVNNVGTAVFEKFSDITDLSAKIRTIQRVNIMSMLKMTQIIIPSMLKKKKGIIVNLSSMSKLRPLKYLQLYGASKSFINYFSEAISYEYEKDGIIIQSLYPSFLKTQLTRSLPSYESLPDSGLWVKQNLATIGKERSTPGDLPNIIQEFVLSRVPRILLNRRFDKILQMNRKYH